MKKKQARIIQQPQNRQWHIHGLAAFMLGLDGTKNAAQVQKERLRTAPVTMLDMVF